jgi:hypothetical protein
MTRPTPLNALRFLAALVLGLAAILAVAAPNADARRTGDLPFYTDTVNITNATGSARVVTAANRWENGTGVDLRWVGPDLYAVAVTFDVDHDHDTADGGTAVVERTSEDGRTGFVAACVAWIKPGLTGSALDKAVSRTVGQCLGWTSKAHGRSVMNPRSSVTQPTARDLDHLRRMFLLNPTEQ